MATPLFIIHHPTDNVLFMYAITHAHSYIGPPVPYSIPIPIPSGGIHFVWSATREQKAIPASTRDPLLSLFPSPPQPTSQPLHHSLLETLLMPSLPAPAPTPAGNHTQPPWPELRAGGGNGSLHQDPLPILNRVGFQAPKGIPSRPLVPFKDSSRVDTFRFDLEAIMQSFDR